MLGYLHWIEGFIGHYQKLGVILLLTDQQLSEIDGACYGWCVVAINSHSIDVSVVIYSEHILKLRYMSKKTHALQPSVSESFISCQYQFVSCKFIENRAKKVHSCVFPEASLVIQDLMSHNVGNCDEFVVRTMFIEVDECLNDIVSEGKVLFCDVLLSPNFDLIVWIHHFCLSIKILLGWR